MQRWVGRVAVVTGTSSGIGAAIAQRLVDHGLIVVGLAPVADTIEGAVDKARKEAEKHYSSHQKTVPGKLYPRQCDVRKEEEILAVFKWVKETLGGVDVMVNNAAVLGKPTLTETNTAEWRSMLDLNVLGLSICTREAIKSMRERGVDDGHIIHITSTGSHEVTDYAPFHFYCGTKHAVLALAEGLRKDLAASKSKIRVSCVSPGLVKTEFLATVSAATHELFYSSSPYLQPGDIADGAMYVLSVPPHVQIHEIMIRPVGQLM